MVYQFFFNKREKNKKSHYFLNESTHNDIICALSY